MPAIRQHRQSEKISADGGLFESLRARAGSGRSYAFDGLSRFALPVGDVLPAKKREPLIWRWTVGLSLGVHAAVVATALLLPAGGGTINPYSQALRVNLILAPEATRPVSNAGTSGSQPASAKPTVASAPDPKLAPALSEPASSVETPVVIQTSASDPVREPQNSAESAKAATTEAVSVPTAAEQRPGDSDAIPAEWNRIVGSAPMEASAIFQARFREVPAPPGYPAESVARNEEGTVWVDLYLSDTGKVLELRVARSSGFPRLDRAAAAAVQRWRFLPSRQLGLALASWVRVPVYFQLH